MGPNFRGHLFRLKFLIAHKYRNAKGHLSLTLCVSFQSLANGWTYFTLSLSPIHT